MSGRKYYIPKDFGSETTKLYKDWKQDHSGPGQGPQVFRAEHPDLFPLKAKDVKIEGHPTAAVLTKKIPSHKKSPQLKAFEDAAEIAAGNPIWNLYGRERGAWYLMGEVDDPSPSSIGGEFGGGRYMVRMVDPSNGMEQIGGGKSLTFNLHPGIYGEAKYAMPASKPANSMPEFEDDGAGFSEEEMEKAKKEAVAQAALQTQLTMLMARGSEDKPKEDSLATVTKVLELQKLLMPPPFIGEVKNPTNQMVETIGGIVTALTTAMTAWTQLKGLLPAPAPVVQEGASMGERMLSGVMEKVVGKMMESPAAAPGQIRALPEASEEAMFESMTKELNVQIGALQAKEAATNSDTVEEMVGWLRSKSGLAWNMLKGQIIKNEPEAIVKFIGDQAPELTDSEFKSDWIKNVCQVMKSPTVEAPVPPAAPAPRPVPNAKTPEKVS